MISVDEAFARYRDLIRPMGPETVDISAALGRVPADDVVATVDLPPFDQSAMDGFALNAASTRGALPDAPVRIRLQGTIAAGPLDEVPRIEPGAAMRIFTGGHLPLGADAALRREWARQEDGWIFVDREIGPGHDARLRGSERTAGSVVAERGQRISAGLLAALSMAGVAELTVSRRPRVVVLTTGDEVVAPGQPLVSGQVYDANAACVRAWFSQRGYDVQPRHVADDRALLTQLLSASVDSADLVITTGGVSVGDKDYVLESSKAAGFEEVFWKVKQKPGKPLYVAQARGTVLFGLPGNPAAVFANLCTHVERALALMAGERSPGPVIRRGVMAASLRNDAVRDRWVRCRVEDDEEGRATLVALDGQGSGMLGNLAECTALAWIRPAATAMEAGTVVEWIAVG